MGLNEGVSASAVLKTLAYADIFDYPLTNEEIWQWLIYSIPLTSFSNPLSLKENLLELTKKGKIDYKNKFYFLPGREKITTIRIERKGWSLEKLKIAFQTANKLKTIPWIKMIGVTGALAMKNCFLGDDIDLAIITTKDRLWLTRLMILFLSPFLGIKRRKPKETNVQDKICFNLFLDEDHLKVSEQNLFFAHEICQVRPLFNKDNTYERFLWKNKWVREYLPNAMGRVEGGKGKSGRGEGNPFTLLEKLAFKLQYFYMKSKITNEKISLHQAFFHPENVEDEVLDKFASKTRLLGA